MFLAPAFLLGLLAIGMPLWLHRVARANPTQHPFASLMLLEASETQRTAKRTLRYWLLLATAHPVAARAGAGVCRPAADGAHDAAAECQRSAARHPGRHIAVDAARRSLAANASKRRRRFSRKRLRRIA